MTLSASDHRDLFLPLVEGPGHSRQWEGFLDALIARTQARRGVIIIAPAKFAEHEPPTVIQRTAARAVHEPPADIAALLALDLQPLRSLRTGRVYALEELLNYDDPGRPERQRTALAAIGIRFARWLRVTGEGGTEAWVLLVRAGEDFSSGAVALMSSVAPYLRAALGAYADFVQERLARGMAEDALARLGVGQVLLDAAARVIGTNPLAEAHLDFLNVPGPHPVRRLRLPPKAAERLDRCCADFSAAVASGAERPEPVLIAIEDRPPLLLHPSSNLPIAQGLVQLAAIATFRLPVREDARRGTTMLRELYGLSQREAALAEKLSRGRTISEAGEELRLTKETARNYSKRVYARSGTRGQADLVRVVLCGLTPLA